MEIVAGEPKLNAEKIMIFIQLAKSQGADVVIFPANAIAGKFIGENARRKTFLNNCDAWVEKIIESSAKIAVIFGHADKIIVVQNKRLVAVKKSVFKLKIDGDVYNVACNIGEEFDDAQVDFRINIASTPFRIGESKARDEKFSAQARQSHCPLIYVNTIGIQASGKVIYTFEGNSTVYNSAGKIVQGIETYAEDLKTVDLEDINRMPALELADNEEIDEIYSAIYYGVEKFLKQINISKVVIGISGGIDSAVAAALYTKILGAENIYLVNMPSVFNTATTRGLSRQLAKNLGCNYAVMAIQDSVERTVKQLEDTMFMRDNKPMRLTVSDFVKENIQARDRSSRILAAVAAAVGGVFTCNANKAETTIGYATLYGDAAGFLCALADLWKFQIYALANYLNKEIFEQEVIPQGIIDIVPSAELSSAQNVDEGKGDPLKYPYHDYLFRAFIEEGLMPEDILNFYKAGTVEKNIGCEVGLVKKYFSTEEEFTADLSRWWNLFTGIAAAKRLQTPPIIVLSKHAYGE
ncbi:MAG: NAD(+) synthase [Selenomonadaceae bacterium]|nr:NAD(+) synthase [Selenomonadaceae bacterium]